MLSLLLHLNSVVSAESACCLAESCSALSYGVFWFLPRWLK